MQQASGLSKQDNISPQTYSTGAMIAVIGHDSMQAERFTGLTRAWVNFGPSVPTPPGLPLLFSNIFVPQHPFLWSTCEPGVGREGQTEERGPTESQDAEEHREKSNKKKMHVGSAAECSQVSWRDFNGLWKESKIQTLSKIRRE